MKYQERKGKEGRRNETAEGAGREGRGKTGAENEMEGKDTGKRNTWKGKEDRRNLTAEGGWEGRWGNARAGTK